jgi:hypothetical protein
MKKFRQCLIGSALLMMVSPSAFSAPLIQAPLPSNAYITKNGYEWAWAFAVAPDGSYAGFLPDFSYQSTLGWRLPTTAELALAPSPFDFLFTGANVPLGHNDPISGAWFAYPTAALTGDAACATGYFVDRDGYNHCDWGNAPGTGLYFDGNQYTDISLPWWGQAGAQTWSETLAIREIPEPGGMALLAAALAGIGFLRIRRQ